MIDKKTHIDLNHLVYCNKNIYKYIYVSKDRFNPEWSKIEYANAVLKRDGCLYCYNDNDYNSTFNFNKEEEEGNKNDISQRSLPVWNKRIDFMDGETTGFNNHNKNNKNNKNNNNIKISTCQLYIPMDYNGKKIDNNTFGIGKFLFHTKHSRDCKYWYHVCSNLFLMLDQFKPSVPIFSTNVNSCFPSPEPSATSVPSHYTHNNGGQSGRTHN